MRDRTFENSSKLKEQPVRSKLRETYQLVREGSCPRSGERTISSRYARGLSFKMEELGSNNLGVQEIGVTKKAICMQLVIMGIISRKRAQIIAVKKQIQYTFNASNKNPGKTRRAFQPGLHLKKTQTRM